MAQRLATAVRHPLASAASTLPQIPLGDETPRNDEELPLGDETLGTKRRASPAGERGIIDAAPAFLGGRNPEAQFAVKRGNIGRPSFPWGTKPQGINRWRARHSMPPQITLGDETPRTKEELPLGDENLGTEEELPLGDETPGTTTTDNAQHLRVRSKRKRNDNNKDHGHRRPCTKQDTAQPSRVRLKQKKNETTKMMPNHQG